MVKKKTPTETPNAAPLAAGADFSPKQKSSHTLADVIGAGQVVRTYSLEVHGEEFEDLAHEFAKPRGLTVSVR